MTNVCTTCGASLERGLLDRVNAATFLHFKDEKDARFPTYFRWTGWKITQDSTVLASQWVAGRKDGPYFYSSMPGAAGPFEPGMNFSLISEEWQEPFWIDKLHSSNEQEAIAKSIRIVEAGLGRLRAVIDSHLGVPVGV